MGLRLGIVILLGGLFVIFAPLVFLQASSMIYTAGDCDMSARAAKACLLWGIDWSWMKPFGLFGWAIVMIAVPIGTVIACIGLIVTIIYALRRPKTDAPNTNASKTKR